MPVSKKTIKSLAEKLHVDPAKLKAALEDDTNEVDIDIPEVTVFTKDELATRDKAKAGEGATTALEMQIKEFKKENGLDFKGKDLKSLHEYLTTKGEDKEVVEKLRGTIATIEKERDEALGKVGAIQRQSRLEAAVSDTNNGLSKAKVLALMAVDGYEFKEENGAIGAYLNGTKVKDEKLQTDIAYDAVIKDYQTKNNMLGDPDDNTGGKKGGGGGNSGSKAKPVYTRTSEVEKAFNDKHGAGASMGIEHDFAGHLQKAMKEADDAGSPLIMD